MERPRYTYQDTPKGRKRVDTLTGRVSYKYFDGKKKKTGGKQMAKKKTARKTRCLKWSKGRTKCLKRAKR